MKFLVETILDCEAFKKVTKTTISTPEDMSITSFAIEALEKLRIHPFMDNVEIISEDKGEITMEISNLVIAMLGFPKMIVKITAKPTEKEDRMKKFEAAAFQGDICCN